MCVLIIKLASIRTFAVNSHNQFPIHCHHYRMRTSNSVRDSIKNYEGKPREREIECCGLTKINCLSQNSFDWCY